MSFEKLLVLHCAPALTGIKPANLFAVQKGRDDAKRKAAALRQKCEKMGVSINAIDVSEKTTLFFVYNKALLSRTLRSPAKALFLAERGYPTPAPVENSVSRLCRRLKISAGAFPHEIGIFLGYPLEDVEGFIASGGRACKMCGYWKVYGDEAKARTLFKMYTECRRLCFLKAAEGYSVPELCSAYENQYRRHYNESSCYF